MSRHSWGYALGVTLLLLGLAAPVLALRLGFPDDGTLPQDRTERRSYDLVADGFGPGINGPLVIAVDIKDDPAVVYPLLDRRPRGPRYRVGRPGRDQPGRLRRNLDRLPYDRSSRWGDPGHDPPSA